MADALPTDKTEKLSTPPNGNGAANIQDAQTLAQTGEQHEIDTAQDRTRIAPPENPSAGETLALPSQSPLLSNEGGVPKRIGAYEVLDVLGRGGMGVVYKARQAGLNRLAALKMILAAEHASDEERLRFEIEAQAVAKLQHPNIVQIYEVSEEEGRPYFSLEFVDGGTLSGRLDNNPLPARQAADLIEPLARAIHYAHENGILHRDLKPGNILLTMQGTPKITDFGLAKRMGDDSSHQTGTGSILGTPAYMAPEQAEGKIRELGPGVDIYALGSVLYHALTGRPPFVGETVLDTLQQVKNDDPVPPRRLQPKVPRDLEIICLKCLQKEPHKRYHTAADLADDLKRFLDNEPIKARAVSPLGRAIKWARRRPQIAALLALLFVVVVGGFFGMLALWLRAEGLRREATESMIEAKKQEKLANENSAESKRRLYAAEMNLAERAIQDAKVGRVDELLKSQKDKKLRGFEWDFLSSLAKSDTLKLQGHIQSVRDIAFRPDGKQFATAGDDGNVVIWHPDAPDGKKFKFVGGHPHAVTRVVYSDDGGLLASGSSDGSIMIHKDGAMQPWPGHPSAVRALAFGPHADWLASAGDDGVIKIWRLKDGSRTDEEPAKLIGHQYPVVDLAVSPDGARLASASYDRTVRVWDVAAGKDALGHPLHHDHWVTAVAFSPDKKWLASASWDKVVKIWLADGGIEDRELKGMSDDHPEYVPEPIVHLAFSPTSDRLAGVRTDQGLVVWDRENKKVLRYWPGEPGRKRTVAFGIDGRLASVDFDPQNQQSRTLTPSAACLAVAFGKDQNMLAAAGSDGQATWWKLDEKDRQNHFKGPPLAGALRSIAYLPQRNEWAVGGDSGEIFLVPVAPKEGQANVVTLKGDHHWVRAVAADGGHLATGSAHGAINLWNLDAPTTPENTIERAHEGDVLCLAYRPGGKQFASGGADGLVHLWSADGKKIELKAPMKHGGPVTALAYHPTAPVLATASADRIIRLWSADTGELLMDKGGPKELRGHTHAVTALAFSPDANGSRLASGSEDATIKLWDPATGQETLTLRGHTQGITSLAFSPDGKRLASSSWDQTIRIWDGE
jgi:WD40 repeat protein/tRNA A-37 threonylcarbamoyl transferase component Bud32